MGSEALTQTGAMALNVRPSMLIGILTAATMDHDDQQLLFRILSDATHQVFQSMLDRIRKGEPLGQLRDQAGNVSIKLNGFEFCVADIVPFRNAL